MCCGMLNMRCGTWDDVGCGLWDVEYGIRYVGSGMSNVG